MHLSCAVVLQGSTGLCSLLILACMLFAILCDQWQRGWYHSSWSRHSSGGRGGGSLVVHFDWSTEFCVERPGRDRLLEPNPPGSVRALQQKHLDIPREHFALENNEFKWMSYLKTEKKKNNEMAINNAYVCVFTFYECVSCVVYWMDSLNIQYLCRTVPQYFIVYSLV